MAREQKREVELAQAFNNIHRQLMEKRAKSPEAKGLAYDLLIQELLKLETKLISLGK